ncbi:MAG: hypothetical protein JWR10_2177 [Rubritepida sp.]|nr:hypothetical protein [Rubritepida sp.]
MLKNLLLEEVPAPAEHRDFGWRQDEEGARVALRITNHGLRAIGIEPETSSDIGAQLRELTDAEEAKEFALQQDALNAENAAAQVLGDIAPLPAPTKARTGLREAALATVRLGRRRTTWRRLWQRSRRHWAAEPPLAPLALSPSPARARSRKRC